MRTDKYKIDLRDNCGSNEKMANEENMRVDPFQRTSCPDEGGREQWEVLGSLQGKKEAAKGQ